MERRGCFCTPDTAARITVRGNVIVAAENVVSGEPLTRQQWSVYHPVDDLFVIIELAERDSEATVVAEYDALYGYPIGLGIDPKWWISDDEVSYSLTNFIPIPHLPQDEPTASYQRGLSRSPSFTFPPPPTGDGAGRRFR